MKPDLTIGTSQSIEIEVTPDMVACFEGKTVHELYSTSFLVQHMELAARKVITPHLEDNEEGMGCHVEVSHLALTLPGMKVKIEATVSEIRDNKVVVDVEASNLRGKIARGTVTQAIVDKTWLHNRMKELGVIRNIAADEQTHSVCSN